MPRHNLKTYNPAQDSSPGYKTNAADEKAVVLNTVAGPDSDDPRRRDQRSCMCGCGKMPLGRKALFAMGHDARLRGILIRAHLTDTPIHRYRDGQPHEELSAKADAKVFGASFVDALKAAEQRRHLLNKRVLQTAMNSQRLVKVGRWQYTGQVAAVYSTPGGEEYEVKYVTKTGEHRTVRVPATEAPLAPKAA